MSARPKPIAREQLRALAFVVAEALGVGIDAILAPQGELDAAAERRRRALRAAAHIATVQLKASATEVGEVFGGRSASEVRTAAGALRNDLAMDTALGALVAHLTDTWQAAPARSSPEVLLTGTVEAVERTLEAGLLADLRERLEPLLASGETRPDGPK